MARYFVNGGVDNNWSTSGNWSASPGGAGGETVPTSTDDVYLDGSSPNCTIDATANCKDFVCTGYTNALTQSADLNVYGDTFTFVAGMTFNYNVNYAIIFNETATFTSAGKEIGGITHNAHGKILTTDNVTINGIINLGTDPNAPWFFWAGGVLSCKGNITTTGNANPEGTKIEICGVNDQLFDLWSLRSGYITINKSGGTLSFSGKLYNGELTFIPLNGTVLTYIAGTVVHVATGNLAAGEATINTNGINWEMFGIWAGPIILTSNMSVKNVRIGAALFLNGNTIDCSENLLLNFNIFGTTNIKMTGSSKTISGAGSIANPIEIDSAGTISLASNSNFDGDLTITAGEFDLAGYTLNHAGDIDNDGTFTHSNGKVVFDGTATQTISGNITFKNVDMQPGSKVQLTAGESFPVEGTLNILGTSALPVTLDTDDPGTKAEMDVTTVGIVKHCAATDIDSAGGAAVRNRNGTVNNCDNWTADRIKSKCQHLMQPCG